ncbi:MAG: hypothetical protein O7G85_11550 [Planctomycetota bacterium]|nr:hypothetical protein [Planctomycetota bacterium]
MLEALSVRGLRMMVLVVNTRESIQQLAEAEPEGASAYRDHAQFEETMNQAADRIARWRGLRLQWFALTVVGVVLATLTILNLLAYFVISGIENFINPAVLMLAWTLAIGWTWLYRAQLDRIADRIIEKRLCLQCGKSLLEEPCDEDGVGVCSTCCHVYHLDEYTPPGSCVQALRTARAKTASLHEPPLVYPEIPRMQPATIRLEPPDVTNPANSPFLGLYENRKHFHNVMDDASRRILFQRFSGLHFLVSALLGMIPPLALFAWCYFYETKLVLMIGAGIGGMWLYLSIYVWGYDSIRRRILIDNLCLGCGYELVKLSTNDHGCALCPKCDRPFHLNTYRPPGTDVQNPNWRETQQTLFESLEALKAQLESDQRESVHRPELKQRQRPPSRPHLICRSCGYDLVGSPVDELGQGHCSECGHDFHSYTR